MPLRKHLADPDITAEVARAMALAYDQVRAALQASAIELPLDVIAERIAEEAHKGVHDADILTHIALSSLIHKEKEKTKCIRNKPEPGARIGS